MNKRRFKQATESDESEESFLFSSAIISSISFDISSLENKVFWSEKKDVMGQLTKMIFNSCKKTNGLKEKRQ